MAKKKGKGKFYFSGAHLEGLRNRTFMQQVTEEMDIDFQGAWKVVIFNMGNDSYTVTDSGGQDMVIPAGVPGSQINMTACLTFDGSPEICRDDIIHIKFAGFPLSTPLLNILFHRIVPALDDQEYPVNEYDKEA